MERASIIVVGAGPAGIATAVQAREAGFTHLVILEKRGHICDTVVSLYHEGKRVDPVYRKVKVEPIGKLSFDTETREAFLDQMNRVVADYQLDIRFRSECQKVVQKKAAFHVQASGSLELESPIVVVAIGMFGRPVKPGYPIPKEVLDRVHFSQPKTPPRGEEILVVGGGDTAAETACFLSCDNKVTLSYRKPEFFRINELNVCGLRDRTCEGNLNLKMASDIEGLGPDGDKVRVQFTGEGSLRFDRVYYCLGGSTPQAFLEGIGVSCDGKRPSVDEYGETNIPGLFLVGDLVVDKGSIMAAFNSAKRTMDGILARHRALL